MKQYCCLLLLCSFMLFGATANLAAGLELFSYQDDLGQIIVTDSLEKVPEKFRGIVRREFIPAFRSQKTKKTPDLTIIEPENPAKQDLSDLSTDLPGSEMQIVAPPDEAEDLHVASASRFMENIKLIQLNNERIYFLAENHSFTHPSILALQQTSIKNLQELENLEKLAWEKGQGWKKSALQIVGRLKTIRYTINKWIHDGGRGLKSGLPPLLNVMRGRIDRLENELNKLR